jgi:hypothetical protein
VQPWFFSVGFFWDRLNTHQCSYVKTKGFIKKKSLPGQTEGLKGWLRNGWAAGWVYGWAEDKTKGFIKPLALGWIGGRKDGYKGGA